MSLSTGSGSNFAGGGPVAARARASASSRPFARDGPISFSHTYTDTDHAHDIFTFAPENLVNKLDYAGDTKGNEAGTKTGVRVYFNPITVVTE